MRKVQAHQEIRPADGIDWLDLLETILVYKLPTFTREEILKMFSFTDVGLKETRFYQDVLTEGEATLLLRQLERTTARCPSLPASVSPAPTPKPCWCGASVFLMPTAWTRFGGADVFACDGGQSRKRIQRCRQIGRRSHAAYGSNNGGRM